MTEGFTANTPDLIDAIMKASRIAPKRGYAFDIAGGIRFESLGDKIVVKASDLDTNYRQEIPGEGDFESFRIPSSVITSWVAALPTGEGSQINITISRDEQKVSFFSETSKATFSLVTGESFPEFEEYDPSALGEIDNFAGRLRQVSWACHRDSVPLSGVHIDGDYLVGCDQARMAEVECSVPVDAPVTAPLTGVSSALRGHKGPVGVAVSDKKLYLSPDHDTQITSTLYEAVYPDIGTLRKMVEGVRETSVLSDVLTASMSRINALCSQERYPAVEMSLEGTSMHLRATVSELGDVEEMLEFETGLGSDSIALKFTPTTLADIATAADGSVITIGWPGDLSPLKPIRVTDGQGFNCIAMPRR